MLCDTGPLVSLLIKSDPYHVHCSAAAAKLPRTPLVTTWPCITEAMHLLGRSDGWRAQKQLWRMLDQGFVKLTQQREIDRFRIAELMAKYFDSPMDVADASLVMAAEVANDNRIFTLDQHFRAYLIHDRIPFEIVP